MRIHNFIAIILSSLTFDLDSHISLTLYIYIYIYQIPKPTILFKLKVNK